MSVSYLFTIKPQLREIPFPHSMNNSTYFRNARLEEMTKWSFLLLYSLIPYFICSLFYMSIPATFSGLLLWDSDTNPGYAGFSLSAPLAIAARIPESQEHFFIFKSVFGEILQAIWVTYLLAKSQHFGVFFLLKNFKILEIKPMNSNMTVMFVLINLSVQLLAKQIYHTYYFQSHLILMILNGLLKSLTAILPQLFKPMKKTPDINIRILHHYKRKPVLIETPILMMLSVYNKLNHCKCHLKGYKIQFFHHLECTPD